MTKRKERMKELIQYAEDVMDDSGYAVIDVKLPDEENLYNPLSTGANLDLNEDIYQFIDLQANIIPAKIPLKIRFHGRADEDRQQEIRRLMHRHYTMRSYDVTWDFAANFRKTIFLAVFGIAVLIAYFLVSLLKGEQLFAEILSIVGTFSLWEAANAILLDRPALRRQHAGVEQNINQVVEFAPEEEDDSRALEQGADGGQQALPPANSEADEADCTDLSFAQDINDNSDKNDGVNDQDEK